MKTKKLKENFDINEDLELFFKRNQILDTSTNKKKHYAIKHKRVLHNK